MKTAGYSFLVLGFLAAAYFTVLDIQATAWSMFVPSAIAAMFGVYLIKRHARGESRSEQVLTANKAELNESLGNIVSGLDEILANYDNTATGAIRDEVDARLRDDLRRFADARESMIHLYGVQTYANIMSEFAAGERYVNRVWSASADDYRNEAGKYLERGAAQFRDALKSLQQAAS